MKAALVVVAAAVVAAGAGCRGCRGPAADESATAAQPAGDTYTPPREGTTSLVQSLHVRREANGDVVVDGRLLLPASTRIWVELFPAASSPDATPVGRAELYLSAGGVFDTGPLKAPGDPELRVMITSHFTRSWQSPEVLAAVGVGGMKLPKTALMPNDPSNPLAAAHLESSSVVKVGS